jgi:hypothetical protein
LLLTLIGFLIACSTPVRSRWWRSWTLACSNAVLPALSRYSNAALARGKSTQANYMKKPEWVQPVEKKGKCFRFIAPIICRPRKPLDRLAPQKSMKTKC